MSYRSTRPPRAAMPTIVCLTLFSTTALAQQAAEGVEEVVVESTRSGRTTRNEPVRVEVLGREEIEEKLMMTPGNIAMLVSETPGIRTQVTSPSLGAANIRMQGLKGRYTQLLADGLPLYGGQAPAIGLLQIAPTDLGQVEVIKGTASALYGPSALGGVINLISRRPGAAPQSEVLLNGTSRGGLDLTAYTAAPLSQSWGYSATGGYNHQDRQDLDGDGWIDMPGYDRWSLRPRLFWNGADGAKAYLTAGAMSEQRSGGTLPGRTVADGTSFAQLLRSKRFDSGLVSEFPLQGIGTLHIRASGMRQDDKHRFGGVAENDNHQSYFAEATMTGRADRLSWLAGAALEDDKYRSATFPGFNYTYTAPALLAQAEYDLLDDVTLSASGRWDDHSRYGSRFSPRVSALYRPGPWTFRASLGQGFFAPTPFVEGIDEVGLSRLAPLTGLRAETATTASFDAGYSAGAFSANVTLFASDIKNAVQVEKLATTPGNGIIRLFNADGPTRTRGAELMLKYAWRSLLVTGSYVFTDTSETSPAGPGRRMVPLTPPHTASLVAMWEEYGVGRIGFESYYTGRQLLEDNPYRGKGSPYVQLGLFGELVFQDFRIFLNAENLLDERQTKYDPLTLRQRAPDGRWTVDAWAPTEGFVLNGGVRIMLGD